MTDSNVIALGILGILFCIYVGLGGLVLFLLTNGLKGSGEDTLTKRIIGLPFLPAFMAWFILLACVSLPFWWLYPEKHMTQIDGGGSDEEKVMLQAYREECRKKGFLRRVAEKLGLAPKSGPAWPFPAK